MPSSLWQDGEPLPRSRARESAVCMCFGRSKVPGLQQWHRARACPRFFFLCVEPRDSGSHSGERRLAWVPLVCAVQLCTAVLCMAMGTCLLCSS